MKKIITIFFTLCLCLALSSCGIERNPSILFDFGILFGKSDIPEYSENFDQGFIESFGENYSYTPNLAYYSASPWEAEQEDGNTDRRFSLIDGTDKEQFVAVSSAYRNKSDRSDFIGSVNVYRHNNAPDPIKDWTVKSISFIAIDQNVQPSRTFCENDTDTNLLGYKYTDAPITLEELSVSYMSLFGEKQICCFDKGNDTDIVEVITQACRAPEIIESFTEMTIRNLSDVFFEQIYVVISFEENDNIVWYTTVSTNPEQTEIYIDMLTGSIQKGVIGGEFAEKIYNSFTFPEIGEKQ